jgi:hypothetical protein
VRGGRPIAFLPSGTGWARPVPRWSPPAALVPPEELNRVAFRLYERFRPDVPEGAQGWGAKGELRMERIVGAVG